MYCPNLFNISQLRSMYVSSISVGLKAVHTIGGLTSIKIARRIEKLRYSNYFHSGGGEKVFACQVVCFALPF